MMDLQQLRHLNQDLLQRLKANQEEFRKHLPFVLASSSGTPERKRMLSSRNRIQPPLFHPDVEGATLNVSETKNSQLDLDSLQSERRRRGCSPSWGPPRPPYMVVVPLAEAGNGNGETAKEDAPQKPPPAASFPEAKERMGPREELTQSPAEKERRQGTSAQMPQTPKSILLTPGGKHSRARKKKEAGHVTFVSDREEHLIPADSMSAQPFLGYDWIAGLLETDTSLSEKPEEYFAELQTFRQVNKEACIRDHGFELEDVNSSALDQEMETEADSHQCVFCYRLNKRLFTVPTDPESACPVCKTPRAEKPPETLVEPAFVRVSFPRATFLPTYKHKIHRRKSYEMEDNLALPSHCLLGWENPVRVSTPVVSSLDLHSSLDSRCPHQNAGSRVAGGTRTDKLLDRSRVVEFELGSAPWKQMHQSDANIHWNNWQPWVCMCELHKQARIRHFVVWGANVSLDLKTSEFWQEKPCSFEDCRVCASEDCPGKVARSGFLTQVQSLSSPRPHEVRIPLPPHLDFPSYDSLPVMDDKDGE